LLAVGIMIAVLLMLTGERKIFSFALAADGKRLIAARGSRKDDIVLI